jgi:ribose transport system permease protein
MVARQSKPRSTRSISGLRKFLAWGWRALVSRRESVVFALLVVVSLLLSLQTDTFFTANNLTNISRALSHTAIAAFGESMVIIIGGIDLSVGAVMALSGLISALCVKAGLPVPSAVVAGILAGGLVGWVNGNLVGRMNLPPFIVTLATMSVVRGIVFGLTGGWPVRDLSPGFRWLGQHDLQICAQACAPLLRGLSLPLPVLIMLGLALLVGSLMNKTVLGKYIYTVANSEPALLASGVNVVRIKVLVYTMCGILVAISGLLMTAKLGVAAPTAATGYELNIIAAAITGGVSLLGGQGSIVGVLLGAAVMQMLRNGLVHLGFSAYWQTAALGTMILLFILLDYAASATKATGAYEWRRRM